MLDLGKELSGLKKNTQNPSYKLSSNQKNFLTRDLTSASEEDLWIETEQLKDMFTVSYLELGRRLHELRNRYANNKNGSFQKKYQEKGLKKTQVETLITKFEIYSEQKNNIGCNATDIVLIGEKLENLSQRATAKLKKASEEEKEKFFKGDGTVEEIVEAEIVEEELEYQLFNKRYRAISKSSKKKFNNLSNSKKKKIDKALKVLEDLLK